MKDQFGRTITYLRVSVLDRCNLKCRYCMPAHGIAVDPWNELLNHEEWGTLIQCFAELGITKVRFTGGEPLLRNDLSDLVKRTRQIPQIKEIALSTNGVLLKKYAVSLKEAGLDRVNISLDTLVPEKFEQISRLNQLPQVLEGIEEAVRVGLKPIKLNTVLMKNVNDNEILDLVEFAIQNGMDIRFIELMPTNNLLPINVKDHFMATDEAQKVIEQKFQLEAFDTYKSSPASLFSVQGTKTKIGFISPISNFFCARCNRVRLKANGMLKTCLHGAEDLDLKQMVRSGHSSQEIKEAIKETVFKRPEEHFLNNTQVAHKDFQMSQVGG